MGNSAAALFKDGKLVAAVEEERLSRIKNDGRFPYCSINELLIIEGITFSDINTIAIYWKPWKVFTRILATTKKLIVSTSSVNALTKRVYDVLSYSKESNNGSWLDLFLIKRKIRDKYGEFDGKIRFFDHHLTHQKYGEIISGYKDYISLSYDGGGEADSTVLSIVVNGKKKILTKHKWPNSLGHFYSTFTGFLGFKMLEGEYKMMGLSPYGKPRFKEEILSNILKLKKNKRYILNTKLCNYHSALENKFNNKFTRLFGPKRQKGEKPTSTHIDLACSVQKVFEMALQHVLSPAIIDYPNIKRLVLTGGCALNVTANGKLLSSNIVDEIIIPPAPHDAGCAIGAAICSLESENIKIDSKSVKNPYLGRNFSQQEIYTELTKYFKTNLIAQDENELIEKTVKLLIQGKLIAWFQGAAEFGPRALGARSFLADPRNDKIRSQINAKIKKRELFRPFAPSTTEDEFEKIFTLRQPSPYMNVVSNVKTKDIPAVTHIDGTSRVHTVSKNSHNRYYNLISHFGKITGIPVLLNTSFNIQEPIVYSPRDAIKTFCNSEVDIIVMGDYLLSREDLKN